jgi:hypothetical protein
MFQRKRPLGMACAGPHFLIAVMHSLDSNRECCCDVFRRRWSIKESCAGRDGIMPRSEAMPIVYRFDGER